jgi:hypothetical protein
MANDCSGDPPDAPPEHLIAAAGRGVKDALREHKLKGNPVAIWHDGKVVWVPPEKIEI